MNGMRFWAAFLTCGFILAGLAYAAWPRYNNRTGEGGDADRNDMGHSGYGCYGLNVAVGDIDGDPQQEIVVTYDNHHIQAFDPNGEALDAAPWFTNRSSDYLGARMTWGQFIRWYDPDVEEDHYHRQACRPPPLWICKGMPARRSWCRSTTVS